MGDTRPARNLKRDMGHGIRGKGSGIRNSGPEFGIRNQLYISCASPAPSVEPPTRKAPLLIQEGPERKRRGVVTRRLRQSSGDRRTLAEHGQSVLRIAHGFVIEGKAHGHESGGRGYVYQYIL